jgi:imidazole glycerol phosphate synthase subunit HisF
LEVFKETDVETALATGIFQRREVRLEEVKTHLRKNAIETR